MFHQGFWGWGIRPLLSSREMGRGGRLAGASSAARLGSQVPFNESVATESCTGGCSDWQGQGLTGMRRGRGTDQAQWEQPGRNPWSPAPCFVSRPLGNNTHRQEVSAHGAATPVGKSWSSQGSQHTAVVGRPFPEVTSPQSQLIL